MKGKIVKISGPVVVAAEMKGVKMYEVVRVGAEGLMGEVIKIEGDKATIQVYEETSGLAPGLDVFPTGMPLSVELGPGLLTGIFDGIVRPLDALRAASGNFIARGVTAPALDQDRKWDFKPLLKKGQKISPGAVVGTVQETNIALHKILVPPDVEGEVAEIVKSGSYTVSEPLMKVKTSQGTKTVSMRQWWPVRRQRPVQKKLEPLIPLVTGRRILDTFFPVAKGGTACIPGPFGSGKTVTQQSIAKWCDADIIVYIGCGERGNEMTDVLKSFPELKDPKSGHPLLERTVIIANTSNMPVAAREASVYAGIAIAEYFRDMGYSVALMADSTSRWAEAMREISARLEEMPGEEGYPAYLATRLSQFYERAGRVTTLNGEEGSVTIIGAISPPGGDFSEPVTQNTLRVNRTFWALEKALAAKRHFPAINWLDSYTLYLDSVTPWFEEHVGKDWRSIRDRAMGLLQQEEKLQEIVQLVGPDALPEQEKLLLEVTKMIREDFLQQNAYHEVDAFCPLKKQLQIISLLLQYYDLALMALKRGIAFKVLTGMKVKEVIGRLKEYPHAQFDSHIETVTREMEREFKQVMQHDN